MVQENHIAAVDVNRDMVDATAISNVGQVSAHVLEDIAVLKMELAEKE